MGGHRLEGSRLRAGLLAAGAMLCLAGPAQAAKHTVNVGAGFGYDLVDQQFVGVGSATTFVGTGGRFNVVSGSGVMDNGSGYCQHWLGDLDPCPPINNLDPAQGLRVFDGLSVPPHIVSSKGSAFRTTPGHVYYFGYQDHPFYDNSGGWSITYSLVGS